MHGKLVSVDGVEIFVICSQNTPLSKVLRRAAYQMEAREQEERENSADAKAYREAVQRSQTTPSDSINMRP